MIDTPLIEEPPKPNIFVRIKESAQERMVKVRDTIARKKAEREERLINQAAAESHLQAISVEAANLLKDPRYEGFQEYLEVLKTDMEQRMRYVLANCNDKGTVDIEACKIAFFLEMYEGVKNYPYEILKKYEKMNKENAG